MSGSITGLGIRNKAAGVAKGGWHPNKDQAGGKKEGWRKDFKGIDQVARWTGHGGKGSKSDYNADDHQSAPLSSLKDPSTFGPPPKRTGTGDGFTGASSSRPSAATGGGGWGSALSQDEINAQRARREQEQREAEEEAEREAHAPPVPYKTDTTGLSTAGLPPPPKFRGDGAAHESARASPAPAGRPVPSLPPRLPARPAASPPPPYEEAAQARPDQGVLNQGALNRLGHAGVSVPGLGIGGDHGTAGAAPSLPTRPHASQPPAAEPASPSGMGHGGQMNELQARFARMGNNPWNTSAASSPTSPSFPPSPTKKKPPPPPPKKKELHSTEVGSEPPPIPVSSKPRQ